MSAIDLKDMVCRGLLLLMQSEGLIRLPARKCTPNNPLAKRKKPAKIQVDQTPIECKLSQISVVLKQVRKTVHEKTFDSLIEQHHYLGYTQPVGEHLKYIGFYNERPIACLAWASAPYHIQVRDQFIGWTKQQRQKRLHLIANNTRFLILPWVKVPYLASHILSKNRKMLCENWRRLYNHPIHLVETFVDTQRYPGTCYKADNWILAGLTRGYGKRNNTHIQRVSKKAVFVKALDKNFRNRLCHEA